MKEYEELAGVACLCGPRTIRDAVRRLSIQFSGMPIDEVELRVSPENERDARELVSTIDFVKIGVVTDSEYAKKEWSVHYSDFGYGSVGS